MTLILNANRGRQNGIEGILFFPRISKTSKPYQIKIHTAKKDHCLTPEERCVSLRHEQDQTIYLKEIIIIESFQFATQTKVFNKQ